MEQNTKDWHSWRREGIGASDAPVIMKVSPHKTIYQLYLEKTTSSQKEEDNDFVKQKGHILEAKARAIFEIKMGHKFEPMLAEHKDYPIFRASLDGYNKDFNEGWEGKFTGQEKFKKVKETGKPLEEHYPQVQHQLMVSGAKCIHYMVYTSDKKFNITGHHTIIVEPDKLYIHNMIKEELKFWDCVYNKTAPGLSEKDCLKIKDKELIKLISNYLVTVKTIEHLKLDVEEMKKIILDKASHSNMECDEAFVRIKGNRKDGGKKVLIRAKKKN